MQFNQFPKRLQAVMTSNAVSCHNVEAGVGLANGTITRYLDGTLTPNVENLYKLSRYFCVSVDYLMGGEADNDTSRPLELTLSELKNILDRITPCGGQDPKVKILVTYGDGSYNFLDIFSVSISEAINCGGFRDLCITVKPHVEPNA